MIDRVVIEEAAKRIAPHVRETPLLKSHTLSERYRATVFLKMENLQLTGSFKARGAMNKLLAMSPDERERGVVGASSGNHGVALARAASVLGTRATVFVPEHAAEGKVKAIRRYGTTVVHHGQDCIEAEARARQLAKSENSTYVSPYNDIHVAAGQGTIACELVRQSDGPIDAVLLSLGGGGLMAGVGSYLKQVTPDCRMVACSPERSPAMHECLRAGRIIDVPCYKTLSDGTAGGVEQDALSFGWCQEVVDDSRLVSEDAIAHHMMRLLDEEKLVVEGAAAVAVAGLQMLPDEWEGKRVVVLLCGSNIDRPTLLRLLTGEVHPTIT